MNTLGEQIRELRKKRNLSQAELAEKIGVYFKDSKSKVISDYETGRRNPSIVMLKKIAEVLDAEVDIFLKPK